MSISTWWYDLIFISVCATYVSHSNSHLQFHVWLTRCHWVLKLFQNHFCHVILRRNAREVKTVTSCATPLHFARCSLHIRASMDVSQNARIPGNQQKYFANAATPPETSSCGCCDYYERYSPCQHPLGNETKSKGERTRETPDEKNWKWTKRSRRAEKKRRRSEGDDL